MATTVLRAKGQVTIPTRIRKAARLEEGDPIEVEMTPDGILLRPRKVIDSTQAWFWTSEWQAGEREATADIRSGRTTPYESASELIAALGPTRKRKAASRKASRRRR